MPLFFSPLCEWHLANYNVHHSTTTHAAVDTATAPAVFLLPMMLLLLPLLLLLLLPLLLLLLQLLLLPRLLQAIGCFCLGTCHLPRDEPGQPENGGLVGALRQPQERAQKASERNEGWLLQFYRTLPSFSST